VFPLKDNIPTERFAAVTVALIVANVVAYFFWQNGGITLGDPSNQDYLQNLYEYASYPYEITHPGEQCFPQGDQITCDANNGAQYGLPPTWLTVFTSMFMHGSLLHLGGNMLFLWIFGNNVEDRLGPVLYLLFYLAAGIVATAAHIAVQPDSTVPVIGASGAIAGVMGAYFIWYPNAPIVALIFIVISVVRAKWLLLFWVALQFLEPFNPNSGVAWVAHVGGFLFGILVALVLRSFGGSRAPGPLPTYGSPYR
jgi:membrane associated rhomboid family serine protease